MSSAAATALNPAPLNTASSQSGPVALTPSPPTQENGVSGDASGVETTFESNPAQTAYCVIRPEQYLLTQQPPQTSSQSMQQQLQQQLQQQFPPHIHLQQIQHPPQNQLHTLLPSQDQHHHQQQQQPPQPPHQLHPTMTLFHEIVYPKSTPQLPCQNVLGIQAFLKRKKSPMGASPTPVIEGLKFLDGTIATTTATAPITANGGTGGPMTQTVTTAMALPTTTMYPTKITSEGDQDTQIGLSRASSVVMEDELSSAVESPVPGRELDSSVSFHFGISDSFESSDAAPSEDAASSAFKPQFAFPVLAVERPGSVPKDAASFNFHPAPLAFVPVAMAPPNAISGNSSSVAAFPQTLAGTEDYIFVDSNGGVIANTALPPGTATLTTPDMLVNHGGGVLMPPGVLTSTPAVAAGVTNHGGVLTPLPGIMQGAVAPHILMAQQQSDDMGLESESQDEEQEAAETAASEGLTPWCKPGKLYSMDVIG